MAFSTLIKDHERIRDYMRQFYVYGFKSREEYDAKSARSYDNERRRIESWLGDYMSFWQDANGKRLFLSVDSRAIRYNPLYQSFKAKSFTDKDIALHFFILDIVADPCSLTVREIVERIENNYLSHFDDAFSLDESTVRKKLKEYENLGLLTAERNGREVRYHLSADTVNLDSWMDAVAFFSEENPAGVIGSFLLDKADVPPSYFGFKHHYILHALDSQVLLDLLTAMREHRAVTLVLRSQHSHKELRRVVYPLKIYASVQGGRRYLLGWHYGRKSITFYRLDAICQVTPGAVDGEHDDYMACYTRFRKYLWGVSTSTVHGVEHIEMTVCVGEGEAHIPQRLQREKRNGTVTQLDAHTWQFAADVYDAAELLPWIRTFIGRITELRCSNQMVVDRFYADLERLRQMYGGEDDAV